MMYHLMTVMMAVIKKTGDIYMDKRKFLCIEGRTVNRYSYNGKQ